MASRPVGRATGHRRPAPGVASRKPGDPPSGARSGERPPGPPESAPRRLRVVAPARGDGPEATQAIELVATVLFMDLRGFTGLAESRRPTDVLTLVNRCFAVLVDCVHTEFGTLDKFLGDGLMAVFGVSIALEDHPERAVRAAVAMQQAMACLSPQLQEDGWQTVGIGVGIETGRMVAGHVGLPERQDFTVLGDVVNVAARLTAGASPGEIVLGSGAAAAVEHSFPLATLGSISIRGRRQPVIAWRVEWEGLEPLPQPVDARTRWP